MKKISALAIAGVMVAAFAAGPAFAETEVKVSGEVRVRHVDQNNYDLNDKSNDASNTTSQRTRVNVDAKVNETTKAYVSLQDTRNWGSELDGTDAGTSNTDETANENDNAVDVSQAYVQFDKLAGQPLSAKLGRQVLAYGDQRLIGGLEWSDNARRFDALKFAYSQEVVNVDLFLANVKEVGAASVTNTVPDAQLNGIYATLKTIPMHKALDLYLLQKANNLQGENIMTYGARLDGGVAGADWAAEFAMQGGDASKAAGSPAVTKEASMLAVKAGYTLADIMGLRIGAEYDMATGEDSTSTDKSEAWDNLYPTNHGHYGVGDYIGGLSGVTVVGISSGLKALSLNVSAKPAEGLKVQAEYWTFDSNTGNSDITLGNEMNLQAWYAVSSNVDIHGYVAQFTPTSDFAGATTDAATNVTLQATVKF